MAEITKRRRTRGNGEGTAFKLPNGRWRIEVTQGWKTVTDAEGKERIKRKIITKSGFKTKRDALAYIPQLRAQTVGVDAGIQFYKMYDKWSDTHFQNITRDTKNCYIAAYKRCAPLYYMTFSEIKTQDLQATIDACELGRRTKENMKALLTCVYDYAIANDYCSKNYAQYVQLPKKENTTKDAFTKDERDALWKLHNGGNTFVGYILTMIYTGMRYGEISTIIKENVHLDEHYMIGGIKTEAGKNRVIPLCDKILPVVEKLMSLDGEKLLDMAEKKFYTTFAVNLENANIRQLPPHSCRHTTATALAEAGVQPALIQAILGHTDYSTTMQYTHVQKLPELLAAINRIE